MSWTQIGKKKLGARTPDQIISNKTGESKVDIEQFPARLAGHQFVMNFVKYDFDPDASASNDTTLSVAFPIPQSGLVDKTDLKYNASEMGTMGAAIASVGGKLKETFDSLGTSSAGDKPVLDYKAITKDAVAAGTAIARNMAPEPLKQGASLALGNVSNPHVALLFEGVGLKTFSFMWRFSPDSEAESKRLTKILNQIKSVVHPAFTSSGKDGNNFFLDFPNQVDLYYLGSQDYLHYFKRCSVTSMEVNYQPEGTSFFAGGAPTMIELSMAFQETEIWTSDDFAQSGVGE